MSVAGSTRASDGVVKQARRRPPDVPPTIALLRDEVEAYLQTLHFSPDPMCEGLEQAMRYSLLAGGRRIRPALALATARALGIDLRTVRPLAAAIELIHGVDHP